MRVSLAVFVLASACRAAAPPAAAPANVPAELGADRVTAVPGVSVGVVTVGMPDAEVRARLGRPDVVNDHVDTSYLQYYGHGLSVALAGGQVTAIHAYSGVHGGYETEPWRPFDLRLITGVTFSSTYDAVVAAYGPAPNHGDLAGAPIPSKWIDYGPILFDFRIDDGRLFHVVVAADAPALP